MESKLKIKIEFNFVCNIIMRSKKQNGVLRYDEYGSSVIRDNASNILPSLRQNSQ